MFIIFAVKFTWLERSKLVKLLLSRKYVWIMKEKGYEYELYFQTFHSYLCNYLYCNYKLCFVIAVSYYCYTRNQNSKKTTP